MQQGYKRLKLAGNILLSVGQWGLQWNNLSLGPYGYYNQAQPMAKEVSL